MTAPQSLRDSFLAACELSERIAELKAELAEYPNGPIGAETCGELTGVRETLASLRPLLELAANVLAAADEETAMFRSDSYREKLSASLSALRAALDKGVL